MGTFATNTGAIVGTPFKIGDGPTVLTIPGGATQLQLGVNDDKFADNTGFWSVQVSGPGSVTGVPEPNAAWLCAFGVCGLIVTRFVVAKNGWEAYGRFRARLRHGNESVRIA